MQQLLPEEKVVCLGTKEHQNMQDWESHLQVTLCCFSFSQALPSPHVGNDGLSQLHARSSKLGPEMKSLTAFSPRANEKVNVR